MEYPILRYPNPTQGYILYTDASGIGWSGVLTQEHLDNKGKAKNHPICYVSGQFRGSQLNWAALTKEAYVINMSVRRLSFYITDVEVTIRSDHLPLKKFLNKQNMNSKVNNWAVELEQFRLHLEWIPGSRNLLADSLSCLLDIVPDAQKLKEPDDQEFGSYCFEELEPAKVLETISTEVIELTDGSEDLKCVNDMFLVKDPDAAVFKPRYLPNFRVTAIFSNNRIEVQDECGHKCIRRSAHIKYIEPSEKIVQQLPSEKVLKNYGRSSKLLLAVKDIPNLQFDVAESEESGESPVRTEVVEILDVDTNGSVTTSQNSNFWEHSKNSLESAAGEALEQAGEQRSVKKTMDLELYNRTSEYREHSQKLQSSEKTTDEEMSRKIVHRMLDKGTHLEDSKSREHSRNSWKKQAGVDIENVNVTISTRDDQCSAGVSDFLEHSQNLLLNG